MNLQRTLHWLYRVSNYDFFPRMTNWLKQPIGWVIVAIFFSLLVGAIIGPQGYILAFAFLALLVLGLAWPWLSMRGIHCHLQLPDRQVEENEELEVIFRVKNYWPLPVFGLMVKGDFLQESDDQESVAFALRRVRAWSETEFRIPITPRRRGRLPRGDVSVASGFPFGLMDFSKTVTDFRPAVVWPSCVPLDGFPVSNSTRFCIHGALHDKAGHNGDSIGVRAYRTGDRLSNIHWAQSARSQTLMVRERQAISSTGATIFIDLSPGDHVGEGNHSSFEWTIRIAATLCRHLHETRSPVRVVSFGLPGQKQTCVDNRHGLRPIMDFLANLPTLAEALVAQTASAPSETTELQHPGSAPSLADAGKDHLFAIGSSRSKRIQSAVSNNRVLDYTPIVVAADGFQTEDERFYDTISIDESPIDQDGSRDDQSIVIGLPQSAAEDLVSGWNRSFSDAG